MQLDAQFLPQDGHLWTWCCLRHLHRWLSLVNLYCTTNVTITLFLNYEAVDYHLLHLAFTKA